MELTNEEKKYLACTVDNYVSEDVRRWHSMGEYDSVEFFKHKDTDEETSLYINKYNPHKIEGAKYLRDLWNSLDNQQQGLVVLDFTPRIVPREGTTPGYYEYVVEAINKLFNHPENLIKAILKVTLLATLERFRVK